MYHSQKYPGIIRRKALSVMLAAAMLVSAAVPSAGLAINAALTASAAVDADSVITEGDFVYTLDQDGKAVLLQYIGSSKEVVVPAEIGGAEVADLGRGVFQNCTKVTLPDNSSYAVHRDAFIGCSQLRTIVFPAHSGGVTVDEGAFRDCTALEEIITEATGGTVCAVNGVLYSGDKKQLLCYPAAAPARSFVLPDGTETMDPYAFNQLSRLENLDLSQNTAMRTFDPAVLKGTVSLKTIALSAYCTITDTELLSALAGLESVTVSADSMAYTSVEGVLYNKDMSVMLHYPAGRQAGTFTLPASVQEMDYYGMTANRALKSVSVASGNAKFSAADGVLFFTDSLMKSLVLYPAGKQTASYTVPEDIDQITPNAFAANPYLQNVTIGGKTESVCMDAFLDCTGLKSVTIGKNVQYMYVNPFVGCNQLTTITVEDGNEHFYTTDNVLYRIADTVDEINGTSDVSLMAYPAGKRTSSFAIPEGVSVIDPEAFAGNSSISSITMPSTLRFIDYAAFRDCTALSAVSLSGSVTDLNDEVFAGCTALTDITLPASVNTVGVNVFDGCTSLANIVSASPVYQTLGGVLFDDDGSDLLCYPAGKQEKTYTVPESVTWISDYAFKDNTSLQELTLSRNLVGVGGDSLAGCTALEKLTVFPDTAFSPESEGLPLSLVLFGEEDSSAQRYARSHGIQFVNMSSETILNLSGLKSYNLYEGDQIVVNGKASGGSGSYQFSFDYQKEGASDWTSIENDKTNPDTAVLTLKAGSYQFRVIAADQSGNRKERILKVTVKPGLSNQSSLEKKTVYAGEAVVIKAGAKGGDGAYTYAYAYKPAAKDTWSKISAGFCDQDSVSFVPKSTGAYDVQVKVKDGRKAVSTRVLTVNVSDVSLLKNNSTVSSKAVKVGDTVRLTAKASGGKTAYRYAFYFKRKTSANWNVLGTEFGTAKTATFKPVSAAIYDVRVDIKDASGQLASKSFTVTADSGVFENISALNREQFSDLTTPIRLYGLGIGGQGIYSYAYYFKRSVNSKWNPIGTVFGTQKEVRFYPTAYTSYDLMICVKDETGTVLSKTFTITSDKADPLENTSTLQKNAVLAGSPVVLNGSAKGGTAPYKYTYRFKRKTNTTWKTIGTADTKNVKSSITPTSAGEFEFEIIVTDATGKTVTKHLEASVYDIRNESTLINDTVKLGSSVVVSSKASGGLGDYRYACYYRKSGETKWQNVGTEWTESTAANVVPDEAGVYELKSSVRDASGVVVDKTWQFTVYTDLENTSSVNHTTIEKGSTVVVTGAAEGGYGEYSYAYYYKKADASSWYTIGTEFTSNTEAKLTPSSITTYEFKVVVKDEKNQTAEKIFRVTVKSSKSDELPIVPAL